MKPIFAAFLMPLACLGADRPTFDVASIQAFHDDGVSARNTRTWSPEGITFSGCSLGFILAEAYSAPPGRVIGPGSLTKESLWPALSQGYNLTAKAGHPASKEQIRLMLRSLLADRFHLEAHRETKTGSAYRLTIAKGGPKLEQSQDSNGGFDLSRTAGGYSFRNAEVMRLSNFLSGRVDHDVVDETGLKGLYNFTLQMPEDVVTDPSHKREGSSPDSPAASRFADAVKRLGLQMSPGQAAIEYLVVDRVEPLSGN